MPDVTFASPDLTTFCRLDELGLQVVGQQVTPDRAVLACRVVEPDDWCRRCGSQGLPRDTVVRRLAHEPFGWRPTTLLVTVRRYRCTECAHVWRQDTTAAAEPRAKISRAGLRWALVGIVCQHLSMARVAEGLDVAWNTANDAVLDEGRRVLIADPHRLDGVAAVGVDEHVWRHTRRGDKYVTVIIDLTPVRDGTGPARLLDMVEGRSRARQQMHDVIQALADAVPAGLTELRKLGRTLNRRAEDVLAYFDRPHTSNGPTEAINGRLEHLRGSALGFRNLTHYIARSLLEAGGFRPQLHPRL